MSQRPAARSALAKRHDRSVPIEALVIEAVLPVLDRYPEFNASLDGDDVILHKRYDIGLAVDTGEGLIVPIIKGANRMDLMEMADEITRLSTAARQRTLVPDEVVGATFTVSNIGAVGGGFGTPIIPYGTTAILSIGRAADTPVVRNGAVAIAPMVPLSLSYDHRIIDGGLGRAFMGMLMENLEEPALFHNRSISRQEVQERVASVMKQVGVDPKWSNRYPHEFSGGQRQRISIARALMVDPEFIVADEPVSALDVSIQAQILNLLMEAQEKRGLTYMFITHDLSVVEHISSRVAVMYLGTICELAKVKELFANPLHPYTKALLTAIPKLGQQKPKHIKLKGEVPTPIHLPPGCVFHVRCPHAQDVCRKEIPPLRELGDQHFVACFFAESL